MVSAFRVTSTCGSIALTLNAEASAIAAPRPMAASLNVDPVPLRSTPVPLRSMPVPDFSIVLFMSYSKMVA